MERENQGIHGFKNGVPAYPHNSFEEVQLFIDTWGFLPNDNSILEKLTKKQLIELCIYAFSSACRIDLHGKGIKFVQEFMYKIGISPENITNLTN